MAESAFSAFWNNPLAGIEAIFSPLTDAFSSSSMAPGGVGSPVLAGPTTGLANMQIQAYGIDPNTGKPFIDNISNAVAHGYDASNPQGFLDAVAKQVSDQYEHDYEVSYNDTPLLPDVSYGGGGSWMLLVLLVLVVILLVFILKVF